MTAFLDLKAQIKAQVDFTPNDKLEEVLAYMKQFEVKKKLSPSERKKKAKHIMKYVDAWNEKSEEDFGEYLKAYRENAVEKEAWRDMAKDDFEACMEIAKSSADIDNYELFKKKMRIEYILSFAGIFEDMDDDVFDDLTVNLHKNRLKATSEPIEF